MKLSIPGLTSYLVTSLALAAAQLAPAATLYVTPGDSIQNTINSANPGDTLVIFGGTYAEDVTINKPLSLGRVQGQTVFITGTVTVSGVQATGAMPMLLSYLTIGGDLSKSLRVNNSSGVLALSCDVKNVNASQSKLTLQKCTVEGNVSASGSTPSDTNSVFHLLQCTVTNDVVTVQLGFARILYSNLRWVNLISADSIVVGNTFSSPQGALKPGAIRLDSGKAVVRNNDISITAGVDFGPSWCCNFDGNNAVWCNNCQLLMANNYVHDLAGGPNEGDNDRDGIYVPSASQPVQIIGNIFWGTRRPVWGPSANVLYAYNDDVDGLNRQGGGVFAQSIIAADPLFLNKTNADYHLSAGSPCIDAGPTDPWYNDRDGTRNDIGLFGGAAYDPDGKTTDKPITFLLQATPLTVIKGVHTNLTISGAGIVIGR